MNCYNGEKYLKESVTSVLNQKYQKWELIFWDNKSNDHSREIFLKFDDIRLKYYYAEKFTNLSEARNLAIEKAKGKLITFLDVDDLWDNNKLLNQYNFYTKNKMKIIYSNYRILNERNNKTKIYSKKKLPQGNITDYLLREYCVGLVTLMIESSIFKIKEYSFSNEYSIIGDFDLILRLSKKYQIGCYQNPICTLRKHAMNDSFVSLSKQITELESWSKKNQLDFFFKKNISLLISKIIYLKFINHIIKYNRIDSLKYIFAQKNILKKLKMIFIFLFISKKYFKKVSTS